MKTRGGSIPTSSVVCFPARLGGKFLNLMEIVSFWLPTNNGLGVHLMAVVVVTAVLLLLLILLSLYVHPRYF